MPNTDTGGWVRRKVKNSEKWVRRWLEVNKHALYSFQACPTENPSARVMNMLDLRKTTNVSLVDDEGTFVIVPESPDNSHPGYLLRAETHTQAIEWVQRLSEARDAARATLAEPRGRDSAFSWCCCLPLAAKTEEKKALLTPQ